MIFDDKEGSEKIILVDKTKKNKIVMDSVKNLIQIECEGDIEIKAKENIVVYSDSLKYTSKEGTTISATQQMLVSSGQGMNVIAKSGMTMKGSSILVNTGQGPAAKVAAPGTGKIGAKGKETAGDQKASQAGGGAGGGGGGGGGGGNDQEI